MRHVVSAALAVAAVLLAWPASGSAALPKPETYTIKPTKSFGGITFSTTVKDGRKEWGMQADCFKNGDASGCQYKVPGEYPDYESGIAGFEAGSDGTVRSVSVAMGSGNTVNTDSPIFRFQTPGGIGLGSRISRVPKEYPNAETPSFAPGQIWGMNRVAHGWNYVTLFHAGEGSNRISSIESFKVNAVP